MNCHGQVGQVHNQVVPPGAPPLGELLTLLNMVLVFAEGLLPHDEELSVLPQVEEL